MRAVFVNYRTGGEDASATLIERELSRQFGSEELLPGLKGRDAEGITW